MHHFDEAIKGTKTKALLAIMADIFPQEIRHILVVGCGSGREAGMLAKAYKAETVGIDTCSEFAFEHAESEPAKLLIMDAQNLQFGDHSFDLIFSFHALEHIPNPAKALSEMARVLRPGGYYLIGTPNKSRLISYIGSPNALNRKILWNMQDFFMRITGRWNNKTGAHAGFTLQELMTDCTHAFGQATDISDDYYRRIYHHKSGLIEWIIQSRFKRIFFPCVYVAGSKSATKS